MNLPDSDVACDVHVMADSQSDGDVLSDSSSRQLDDNSEDVRCDSGERLADSEKKLAKRLNHAGADDLRMKDSQDLDVQAGMYTNHFWSSV